MVSPVTVTVVKVVGVVKMAGMGNTATCDVERITATARVPVSSRSRSVTAAGSVTSTRVAVSRATTVTAAEPARRISARLPLGVTETSVEPGSSIGVSEMATFFTTSGAAERSMIAIPSCVTAYARACPAAKPTLTGR